MPEDWRCSIERLKELPVASAGGKPVPLGELAAIKTEETPPGVEHENVRRRTFIAANVRDRDVASFVAEAQEAVRKNVQLPPGYEVRWGGDFENLQSASLRFGHHHANRVDDHLYFVAHVIRFSTVGSADFPCSARGRFGWHLCIGCA